MIRSDNIRDNYPNTIRALRMKGASIHYDPIGEVYIIGGMITKRFTLDEMDQLELQFTNDTNLKNIRNEFTTDLGRL